MTKRPTGLIVIAVGISLVFLISFVPIARALTGYSGPIANAPPLVAIMEIGFLAFALVLVVNLLQMRPSAIWVTVALLALSASGEVLRFSAHLRSGMRPVVLVFNLAWLALEAAGAWYLSRPAFHAIAKRYRNERDQEAMRRYAEKAVRRTTRP